MGDNRDGIRHVVFLSSMCALANYDSCFDSTSPWMRSVLRLGVECDEVVIALPSGDRDERFDLGRFRRDIPVLANTFKIVCETSEPSR